MGRGWIPRPCGFLIPRGDCILKCKFEPERWIEQGLEERKVVFPFKVFAEGGPADQLFFLPEFELLEFQRSLKVLIHTYRLRDLKRTSLHYMHLPECMGGRIAYAADVVCDANSAKEWNPFYCITGRKAKNQKHKYRHKWGYLWFGAVLAPNQMD